ncbi:hypothetical protein PRK78_005956 [Emydomyces testavorans]|uniref:DNA replication factor Cdt1 C-terminal domain-containing protein n=1 Tax=Emydomyces testavorans TaxID=2070801 RepID=A0AAF0DPD7_9EURO|nr:hypothetical protein PRK78_005956 [Emydomyces testavorans]
MPVKTLRSRAAKQSQTPLPLAKTKQASIQGFARAGKASAGVGTAPGKGIGTSLKRKLQDEPIEEITVETQPIRERKILKVGTASWNFSPESATSFAVCEEVTAVHIPNSTLDTPGCEYDEPAIDIKPLTNIDSQHEQQSEHYNRPSSYYELIALYSSFLRALSLHAAHNGITAPADLREFLPNMERVWKKRKVVTEDIQRLLYVGNNGLKSGTSQPTARFRLIDYETRVLLERLGASNPGDLAHGPLNEQELSTEFERNLECIWLEQNTKISGFDCLRDIPLAPIYKIPKTFLSIRRQKASEIRLSIAKAAHAVDNTKEKAPSHKRSCTADRRNALLERIKGKALRQSTLAPPPSKKAIIQRAAAGHIPEVVNVLLLLSPSASTGLDTSPSHEKKAYKLDTIVQNIRDSMRNPVSKEHISTALDILARPEVSGGWITIVSVNSMKSVVLRSSRNVSPQDIKNKAAKLEL